MKAVCYRGTNRLEVEQVADPEILRPRDAIVKLKMSTTCGSDLHLIGGMVPTVKRGDILGHEFIGEVVETGGEVDKFEKGARVVVAPVLGCGGCYFCKNDLWSLCDNSNPSEALEESLGYIPAGILGYSHALGGFAGCHAEYVRVPFADTGMFKVPDSIADEKALFVSDAIPTGYMAAENCQFKSGDVAAVWGCGGVGLMAMASARVLGAERIIAVDHLPERLRLAEEHCGAETINFEEENVLDALREMTGGRGPDACIDAVGMEAVGVGLSDTFDRVKQRLRLVSDRGAALREAIMACRKGGTLSVPGVYLGTIDRFPMGAVMNKALTLRSGQQHGQKYIPRLLKLIEERKLDPSFIITHRMSLDDAPRAYEMFRTKEDGCVRVVFTP